MSLDIMLVCPCCETEVHAQNITHNLNKMAAVAGIYGKLWGYDPVDTAGDLIEPLRKAIRDMRQFPAKYREYDSPNGWGTYKDFVPWLDKLLAACEKWPTATVEVSR